MALSEIDAEVVAEDGSEAEAMASRRRFDVCILDLNLPDISGYDLVGRLLELQGERPPVMIALTGVMGGRRTQPGSRARGLTITSSSPPISMNFIIGQANAEE